ncbi:PREDICTED: glycoprotein hormone beta-5 [Rhagoletis zephyria]|uniref:glycoprotein hormone beta-5 n=1 Tax=Rhagoletis zephyria TaxID=28612 RepID=UPI0008118044|nr:PREDICTED: glycoprotein hormone beta-5 [Rhagoletis zephyria]XP_036321450.1 thyrostimulin beta-5 subunit [Rhagoletis pomonella]
MYQYFNAFALVAFISFSTSALSQVLEAQPINSSPTAAPLGCHQRLYTYRITQADAQGRECWDYVSVRSCWGRCDSSEISDWRFPYKRSFHPVCVHATRQPAVALLRNCHPEASEEARRYEYMEAGSCHCHTCSSLDTSCEAPVNNILDERSGVKVLALTGSDSDVLDY